MIDRNIKRKLRARMVFRCSALGLFPNNPRFRAHWVLLSHLLEVRMVLEIHNTMDYVSRYHVIDYFRV